MTALPNMNNNRGGCMCTYARACRKGACQYSGRQAVQKGVGECGLIET